MKRIERMVESIILASRWLLVIFYVGLAVALLAYSASFGLKLFAFMSKMLSLDETDTILAMLGLIDAALVASLVVMVMISGYENFVSRFDNRESDLEMLGKIDAGSLKVKVASTIVAISSIHLLQIFLNSRQYSPHRDHVAHHHAHGLRLLGAVPRFDRPCHGLRQEGAVEDDALILNAIVRVWKRDWRRQRRPC